MRLSALIERGGTSSFNSISWPMRVPVRAKTLNQPRGRAKCFARAGMAASRAPQHYEGNITDLQQSLPEIVRHGRYDPLEPAREQSGDHDERQHAEHRERHGPERGRDPAERFEGA